MPNVVLVIMALAVTLGRLHVLSGGPVLDKEECSCQDARRGCAPSFVFSVTGQLNFREALHHLTDCRSMSCRSLKAHVYRSMLGKLRWLMKEEFLLGCVHVQPTLYGSSRVRLERKDFSILAQHLYRCPKESCAQLRRSLLLTIRDDMHQW